MRARFVGLRDLTTRDHRHWLDLAARALEPNPFFEPAFMLPAAKWVGRDRIDLLVAEDDEGWAACLPVRRTWRWRRLPLRSLAGWRHLYAYLGTPLVTENRPALALEALVERALAERGTAAVVFDWIGEDGPVGSALAEALNRRRHRAVTYEAFERAVLRRHPGPPYASAGLSVKRLKELRRLERRLADELGAPLTTADRGGEEGACEEFTRLEAAGWKGREGTAIASSERHRRFFGEACAAFREAGRLQLLTLAAGERTVAMQCNVVAAEAIFCFKVAYDEDLAHYSPGVQLELGAIDAFHGRQEVDWMDSCADPHNDLINRLWPDRRRLASIVVARDGAVGRTSLASVRAAAALRGRLQESASPG